MLKDPMKAPWTVSLPLGCLIGAYSALWIALTTMWAEFGKASPAVCVIFALAVFACLRQLTEPVRFDLGFPKGVPSPAAVATGIGLSVPALTYFALTANQEFPFAGDHDHHMYMAQGLLGNFHGFLLLVPVTLALAWWAGRRWRYIWLVYLTCAYLLSLAFPPYEFVLRYPAALYLLAAPANALLRLSGEFSPMLGTRFTNVASVPVWLFVLRPLILQRWPDARAVLLGAFFFLQKDWIYYTTTDFLEPWALVLVLLSVEAALFSENAWLAPLLAGLGCAFKEQAIFALTIVLLPVVLNAGKSRARVVLAAAGFYLPFLVYWSARSNSGIFRKVELVPLDLAFQIEQLARYAAHMNAHLHAGGWIALLILLGLTVLAMARRPKTAVVPAAALAVAIAAELLYLTDKISLEYIGYPRFHYLSWPLLTSGALLLYKDSAAGGRKSLALLAAAAGLLHLLEARTDFALALRPDFERNFMEQYHAPMFFPIGSLLNRLPEHRGWSLALNNPTEGQWLRYSGAAGYGLQLSLFTRVDLLPAPRCECQGPRAATMVLDVYIPQDGPREPNKSVLIQTDVKACVERLKVTCASTVTETAADGFIAGAIGFNP